MELSVSIKEQKNIRSDWQKKRDDLATDKKSGEEVDEDDEAEKYDLEDYYLDKIEQIDLRIADMQTEYMQVKKDQINFLDRKENITKALNVSRRDRAQEITKVNQNFGDLIMFMKKNEDFRRTIGLEIERMRIGIKEEYLRLSDLHMFADNIEDYPILNTEVISRLDKDYEETKSQEKEND